MKSLKIIAATAVLAGSVVGAASTADASTVARKHNPGCITKKEFHRVHKGMSMNKVRHIVGSLGKVDFRYDSDGYHAVDRTFRVCRPFNKWSVVSVDFDNLNPRTYNYTAHKHVSSKSAFWSHN